MLKILHADDPPHHLALGIAIGMFVTFLPLIGIQMAVSFFLAWILGANKLVGVPLVWISNPFTVVPIYYPCYWLGCKLLGGGDVGVEWEQLRGHWHTINTNPASTWGDRAQFWWNGFFDFAGPLGLGCLIVGLTFGIVSYYVSLLAIRRYRMNRWGQLMPPAHTLAPPVLGADSDSTHSGGHAA